MDKRMAVYLFTVALVACGVVSLVEADYSLEILVKGYQNPTHQSFDGGCCDGGSPPCTSCDNAFRFCIRSTITRRAQGTCDIAQFTTNKIASKNDNLTFSVGDTIGDCNNPLTVSGERWPGEVEIFLTVYDLDSSREIDRFSDKVDEIFIHPVVSAVSSPNGSFSGTVNYSGTYSHIQLAFRLTCDPPLYGPNCSFCMDSNDTSGHYYCNPLTGHKICQDGYQNPLTNCTECKPSLNCSLVGGYCKEPGECLCGEDVGCAEAISSNVAIVLSSNVAIVVSSNIPTLPTSKTNDGALLLITIAPVVLAIMIAAVTITILMYHRKVVRSKYSISSANIESNTSEGKMKGDHIYETIGDHTYSTITPRHHTADGVSSYATINVAYDVTHDDAVKLRENVAYGVGNIALLTDNNDDIA